MDKKKKLSGSDHESGQEGDSLPVDISISARAAKSNKAKLSGGKNRGIISSMS
jgi:hypothetical protein